MSNTSQRYFGNAEIETQHTPDWYFLVVAEVLIWRLFFFFYDNIHAVDLMVFTILFLEGLSSTQFQPVPVSEDGYCYGFN